MYIKEKVGTFLLSQELKKMAREITFNNLDSARSIGLVFQYTSQESFEIIKNFILLLKKRKIEVHGFGYVEKPELLKNIPYLEGIEYFTTKDINWYYKPKDPTLYSFCNKPFDILINLCLHKSFALHHIIAISKAHCKVGATIFNNTIYDFFIDIKKENLSLDFYINQIIHYFSLIKARSTEKSMEYSFG
jgi:hypothetical protein